MGTIRTLLAVSVLITHSELIFGRMLLSGDMAVTCFFIVSGFLITLILREKYTDLRPFYVNRALRIYVPYLAALGVSAIAFASLTSGSSHDPIGTARRAVEADSWLWIGWSAISNLTLVGIDLTRYIAVNDDLTIAFPNFLHEPAGGGHGLLFVPQGWTLAIELQFYLLAPLFAGMRARWLAGLIFGLLLMRTVLFGGMRARGIPIDDAAIFPMQLGYFLLGALGYHGYRRFADMALRHAVKRAVSIVAVGFALILIFAGLDLLHDRPRHEYDLFYIAFAATVPFQFYLTRNSRLDQRIGDYSYPIYVFHFAVAAIASQRIAEQWRGEVVLAATVLLCAAYIAAIDRPVQRLRTRIARRGTIERAPLPPQADPAHVVGRAG